jgi:prolyl-tRNA synthetase
MGLRVLRKIEDIIRKHMDTIGTEIIMPSLSPIENREKTNRLNTVDVLMKTSGASDLSKRKCTNEYILNPTHEDVVTPLVQEFVKSHKDLPVAVYQIQSKFRNEARAKSGILRGREFKMKDLYSFHADDADFVQYYERSKEVYTDIFNELGIGEDTYITVASGGDFTEKNSHEFQTLCAAGEDMIYIDTVSGIAYNEEIAPSTAPAYIYNTDLQPIQDIYGENVVSVAKLCEFLTLPVEQCVKTMYYKDENTKLYAVVIRGDYEVNEIKLKRVIGCKKVELISDNEIILYT